MPQRAKIGIVVKPSDLRSQKVALELCDHLKRNKLDFLVDSEGASALSSLKLATSQIVSRKEIVDLVDFVVTLGGDGTFISAARFSTKSAAISSSSSCDFVLLADVREVSQDSSTMTKSSTQ